MTDTVMPELASALDPADVHRDDPFGFLALLREREPVSWCEPLQAFLVTEHSLVHHGLQQRDVFTPAPLTDNLPAEVAEALAGSPLAYVPASVSAWRRVDFYGQVLIPVVNRTVAALESTAAACAAQVQYQPSAGGPVETRELMSGFVHPYVTRALGAAIAGLPDDQVRLWAELAHDIDVWSDPCRPLAMRLDAAARTHDAEAAVREAYAQALADQPRSPYRNAGDEPDDKLYRKVARDGDFEQFVATLRELWLTWSHVTGLLGNSLHQLMRTDLFSTVDLSPTLLHPLFNEMQRLDNGRCLAPRITTTSTRLDGVELPTGTRVTLHLGAANRDEARFARPNAVMQYRGPAGHLTLDRAEHRSLQRLLRPMVHSAIVALAAQWAPHDSGPEESRMRLLPDFRARYLPDPRHRVLLELPVLLTRGQRRPVTTGTQRAVHPL